MKKAEIYYYDIGDYHSREEKLSIIDKFHSVGNIAMNWKQLKPNEHGDWLNQRNDLFETFIPMAPGKKYDYKTNSFFVAYSNGLASGRDYFIYNSSKSIVIEKVAEMLEFYNEQSQKFQFQKKDNPNLAIKNFVAYDSTKISWTDIFLRDAGKGIKYSYDKDRIGKALYRPFFKQFLCYDKTVIHRTYQLPKIFPELNTENLLIIISGKGASKDFSSLITDVIPNYHTLDTDQCFPLYYYEKREKNNPNLFDAAGESESSSAKATTDNFICRDGVSNFILEGAKKQYGKNVGKEDIFYYVYGILHSPDYREAFQNDLKKMLPRIPLVEDVRDFWKFSKAGRKLAELHIKYEEVPPCETCRVSENLTGLEDYRVQKMRFSKTKKEVEGKMKSVNDKSGIIYNSQITISNIPEKAYQYVVNGKSAIEWIMERYQMKTDKKSGIKNDPNDWAEEVDNPRYILDLLLSVINVSVQTVEIVENLPQMEFEIEAKETEII